MAGDREERERLGKEPVVESKCTRRPRESAQRLRVAVAIGEALQAKAGLADQITDSMSLGHGH